MPTARSRKTHKDWQLDVPLSWKKTEGGLKYTWVGHEKSLLEWLRGVSKARAPWLDRCLPRTIEARKVDTRDLREALWRMVYVYGALQYGKPFLALLFALLSFHRIGVE